MTFDRWYENEFAGGCVERTIPHFRAYLEETWYTARSNIPKAFNQLELPIDCEHCSIRKCVKDHHSVECKTELIWNYLTQETKGNLL